MTKQILTTITLLLSLFTYTVAQNRVPREVLEGLRDIGVVVKYGRIDGLKEATPIVLQRLQSRAEETLSEAGVPVLKRTNEADLVNRPRLVLTITESNPKGVWSTISVESRLYERVRLSRDASKELDLATWVQSGVGSAQKATEEMLFQVFDGQLNQFITEYREVNPKPTPALSVAPNATSQLKDEANSFQGLTGISLFVWSGPSGSLEASLEALIKILQGEAEEKFRQAGIPLLKYVKETEAAGRPLLYVSLELRTFNSHAPAIAIESEFWQRVRPLRDLKKETYAVTWESRANGRGPITDDAVRQVMNSQLDEFIKAYKAANPKPSSVPNGKAQ